VPPPAVTDRTTSAQPHELTITGIKGCELLPYGRTRLLAGADSILYSFQPWDNELWYLVPLGAGEIGNLLSVTAQTDARGAVPLYPANSDPGTFQLWFHNGSATQAVDPNLAALDHSWNESLAGSAYLLVRFMNLSAYRGLLPTLEILYEGLKCLDPRDGVTRYTTNTVLQLYDFARRREGKALPAAAINTASIIAAANIADELLADGSRRYASHVTVRDSSDVEDWIKVFRLLCDGFFTWRADQFYLILDRPGTPTAAYGDADLVLSEEIEAERGEPSEAVNHVRVMWLDPTNGWQIAAHDEETLPLQLGHEERVTATYTLPWIQDAGRAKRLAVFLVNSLQFDFRMRLRWAATATATAVGDLVSQSVSSVAIAAQTFRVLSRTPQSDNTYLIELGEYSPAKYSNQVLTAPPKVASTSPDPAAVPPAPVGVAATEQQYMEQSGVVKTRATLSWTTPAYPFFDAVEVLSSAGGVLRMVGEFRSSPAVVPLHEVNEQFNFVFRTRSIYGRRSADSTLPFTARGKQLPPTSVPFLGAAVNDGRVTLRWQKSIDLDLLGYEVRRWRGTIVGTPTTTDLENMWSAATPSGKVDGLVFEEQPPYGSYVYLVSAYDSGKRYSAVPAYCAVTSEPAGSSAESASPLIVYNQIPGPDYLPGTGNMVAEGVNSGRLQFLLSRADSWDDIAAAMAASGLATLDAYDASRAAAELCFPLPENASGRIAGMGATMGGTSTRNIEYTVRLAGEQRIGRSSLVESHQIAQPYCGSQFGSKFTAGAAGMHPRFGLHLSTNDPWCQVVVTGSPIFYVSARRIIVALGEYSGTTAADGRLTLTLPAAKQLEVGQLIYTHTRASSSAFVQLVEESRTNSAVTVRAYDKNANPLSGITVYATIEDRGEGGSSSLILF
jgi:hypothetical protein